ncbi:MAG: Tuberous sclerosis 2-like protein [Chaenotheca gracillima]|nr:MAG: Tuberous sclerosis 2-like protein [Chaenotheca gracillima]
MVRVNHREYQTDTVYESETLARENAAMRAYLICRNFSVNDGKYPAGLKGGTGQGLPVAIGTGRRSTYESASSTGSGGYTSGESSPRSSDGGRDDGRHRVSSRMARGLAYGSSAA